SEVGPGDLAPLLLGKLEPHVADILVASRLPRLLAAVTVGVALGVAGGLLQSVARNNLASPDTLGVNAGAYFAVVLAAAVGASAPLLSTTVVAFAGGRRAAGLVLALSSGAATSPTRLVLAGSVVTLALAAGTQTLQLVKQEQTIGLFAWGSGS